MRKATIGATFGGFSRVTRTASAAVLCFALMTPAVAQGLFEAIPEMSATTLQCRFETECNGTDACVGTTFELTATLEGTGGAALTTPVTGLLSSVAGDLTAVARVTANAQWWEGPETLYGLSDGETHLLTRAEDGTTVYTLHYAAGPVAITYHGNCAMETN